MEGGNVVRSYLAEIDALDDALGEAGERFHPIRAGLRAGLAALTSATEWLISRDDVNDALAGAAPYLRMFGTVAGGYYLARFALHAASDDGARAEDTIDTAVFYAEQLLPQAAGLLPAATGGAAILFAIDPERS
ncbi:MAG: hypothetical protein EHM57_01145 [Actinobacteria bacterium]|nr:MAG: hypothetical protein EHM57_01145 [Actinomycetota bacterium]